MDGGDATVDQMIKSTKRGLLVSFFWYIRPVEQMTLLNTGMTRDGLFLIENGEIAGPVQNFRWNDGPARGFNNISMLGPPRADARRRGVRQSRHRAGAGDEDRGLPDDVDFTGGVANDAERFSPHRARDAGRVRGAHMGHPDFRANGRIFATIAPDAKWGMVKLSPDQQAEFVRAEPETFVPAAGAWGRSGCTMVQFATADGDTLGEAMTLAWQGTVNQVQRRRSHVKPKKSRR